MLEKFYLERPAYCQNNLKIVSKIGLPFQHYKTWPTVGAEKQNNMP